MLRNNFSQDATNPAAILVARRRFDAESVPSTRTRGGNDDQVGEVVGMVSLSVQTYSDLDQSGHLKPPEFFGKSFLGQALVLLGNSLRDALSSNTSSSEDRRDTNGRGQVSSMRQASKESTNEDRFRSGRALVPVLANLAVR